MSKKIRVLFILPHYSDELKARHARIHDIIHNCHEVNIAPFVLANKYSEENPNSNVKVFNPNDSKLPRSELAEKTKNSKKLLSEYIDIVNIVSGGINSAYLPMQIIKKINPNMPIVYGPNISFHHPKTIIRNPEYFSFRNLLRLFSNYVIGWFCYHKRDYDGLIFQSDYHKERIQKEWSIKKPYSIFRARVNTKLFNPYREGIKSEKKENFDLVLGYASGTKPGRGLKTLKKAIDSLSKKTTLKIKVIIAGPGNNIKERFTKHARNNKKIKLKGLGSMKRKKMPNFYNTIDALVVPSVLETSSTIVPESLACGTPVIGSNIPPIQELIYPNRNALVFEPRNFKMLSRTIQDFFENLEFFEKEAEGLHSNYEIQNELKHLKRFYTELKEKFN